MVSGRGEGMVSGREGGGDGEWEGGGDGEWEGGRERGGGGGVGVCAGAPGLCQGLRYHGFSSRGGFQGFKMQGWVAGLAAQCKICSWDNWGIAG